jgi:Arm DNA-binding domain
VGAFVADQRQVLTDKRIAGLCAGEKQYKVRDSELPGFFVLIGKRRKTFMAHGEFWRDGVREFTAQVELGDFGEMTTRQARGKAKEALGSIAKGQRPGDDPKIKAGAITLRQAWERYRDAHMKRKGRSSGTIEGYRDHMERLFKNWLDSPLARLGRQPHLVVERHDQITKENGRYIANGSMRSLRAVYNHARKTNTDLPAVNPVSAIDWNKEHRRNTGMGPNDISGWLKELYAMDNPLRQEFHLLTLFSGYDQPPLKKSA